MIATEGYPAPLPVEPSVFDMPGIGVRHAPESAARHGYSAADYLNNRLGIPRRPRRALAPCPRPSARVALSHHATPDPLRPRLRSSPGFSVAHHGLLAKQRELVRHVFPRLHVHRVIRFVSPHQEVSPFPARPRPGTMASADSSVPIQRIADAAVRIIRTGPEASQPKFNVRRGKARFPCGCEPRPATVAPAGSSQSGLWR